MYYKKGLAMLDGDRIRIEHIDSDMEVLTIRMSFGYAV